MGVPHVSMRYFAAAPWVARAVVDLHLEFGMLQRLDQRTADLIGLVVSQGTYATLFSDLVGFAAHCERLEPAVMARIFDGCFQRIGDAVHAHSGHLPMWLGDGMLACSGALRPNRWQCGGTVRAALAMRDALRECNAELARGGLPPLALGIGIHRGAGLAGMIGSRERREYSFVGRVEASPRATREEMAAPTGG
jgi:adenylate cyclase